MEYLLSTLTQGLNRYKKKGSRRVRGSTVDAILHNRRATHKQQSNIDYARTHLNYHLHGDNDYKNVIAEFNQKIKNLQIRKNGITTIEFLFSLPNTKTIDYCQYFESCYQWLKKRYGAENLLTVDIHLDESYKHCHALLIPFVNQKLQGTKVLGGKKTMFEMHRSFSNEVAKEYGLQTFLSDTNELTNNAMITEIKKMLSNDEIMQHSCWKLIDRAIRAKPKHWYEWLSTQENHNNLIRQLGEKKPITYLVLGDLDFDDYFQSRFINVS